MSHYVGAVTLDITSYDAFKNNVIGNSYDLDGDYGAQCLDLWMELNYNVGGYPYPYVFAGSQGYAYETWTDITARIRNASDKYIMISRKQDIKRGDMVIFAESPESAYGHNAIADEDYHDPSSLNCLGQNQYGEPVPSGGRAVSVDALNLNNFLGAFRPKFWGGTPPHHIKAQNNFPWVLLKRRLQKMRSNI